jgi:hypothetical protein
MGKHRWMLRSFLKDQRAWATTSKVSWTVW